MLLFNACEGVPTNPLKYARRISSMITTTPSIQKCYHPSEQIFENNPKMYTAHARPWNNLSEILTEYTGEQFGANIHLIAEAIQSGSALGSTDESQRAIEVLGWLENFQEVYRVVGRVAWIQMFIQTDICVFMIG